MSSFKQTIDIIILGIYQNHTKNDKINYSIEEIHLIIFNTVTLMPKTIANYLKMMKVMDLIDFDQSGGIVLTDKLLKLGKKLYEKKIEPIVELEKETKTDDLGFFKY
jgi:hypothetical protein